MRLWRYTAGIGILVSLTAYAWGWRPTEKGQRPPPGIHIGFIAEPGCFEHSSVRITIMQQPPGCSVRQAHQEQGHDMSCQLVGSYVRRVLNPPRGSIAGISVRGQPSTESMMELHRDLSAHGFEDGSTVCFVSTSNGNR